MADTDRLEALKAAVLCDAGALGLQWGRDDGVLVPRAAVLAEAREWIGTKFMHQQETKGVAVDCGGLIRGVSVALGLLPENYRKLMPAALHGYGRQPSGDLGECLCNHYWTRIPLDAIQPADVLLFRWHGGPAQHAGFVADAPHQGRFNIIHSLNFIPNMVCEHGLDDKWSKRAIAAYQLPGVA